MTRCEGLKYCFDYQAATVYKTGDFDRLPDSTKSHLEPQLIAAAESGFARDRSQEFADDVAQHLRGGELYVVSVNQVAAGFALMQDHPEMRAAYISGVVKDTTTPSRVIEQVIRYHLQSKGAEIVAVRTQNDRVAEIMAAVSKTVVAIHRPASVEESDLLSKMGLLPPVGKPFDPENLIVPGYYGSPLIQHRARRRSSNSMIRVLTNKLDYNRGDAALLVGYRG